MQAVPRSSPDAGSLIDRLAEMIGAGRLGAARPILAALRRLDAPSARVAELAALLSIKEGRLEDARTELDAAITELPDHAALRRCRADVRHRLGDKPGAALDAAEAVVLDPHDPVGKAILGVLMLEMDRPADAVACLAEAVAARPADPSFREGLARAQAALGDPSTAAATLEAGIIATPGAVSLRNAAVLLAISRHDFARALDLAEQARLVGIADASLFGLKGHALSSLGRHDEAAESYREALKLAPDDVYVRHLVAASGAVPEDRRAPPDYLRAVFDGYAENFDAHLIALGYRVPGLIRAALLEHAPLAESERLGPVLDLGCGTGLLAVALSDLPIGPMIGVDLSPGMLCHAAEKGLYESLHTADAMAVLAEQESCYALIVASDTLCYFGALEGLLAAVRAALRRGGLFVFSVEMLQPSSGAAGSGGGDWALGVRGRYAHAPSYIRRIASDSGFALRAMAEETLRQEADWPVQGVIVVLERPRHDA